MNTLETPLSIKKLGLQKCTLLFLFWRVGTGKKCLIKVVLTPCLEQNKENIKYYQVKNLLELLKQSLYCIVTLFLCKAQTHYS